MYEKITSENVVMFAIRHYDNPQCEGEKEFQDDLKRFKYIKRLLRKYYDTGVLKERLLLNHLIVLLNVFGADACATLLLYKIQEEYWSVSENLEDELDNKLQFNKIIKNMEKLTSLQKEVINLRFAAQMSLSETAKILNKNENSIKSLQHSAIKKLRDILND